MAQSPKISLVPGKPGRFVGQDGGVGLRLYYKPLVLLIWLGAVVMAVGGGVLILGLANQHLIGPGRVSPSALLTFAGLMLRMLPALAQGETVVPFTDYPATFNPTPSPTKSPSPSPTKTPTPTSSPSPTPTSC